MSPLCYTMKMHEIIFKPIGLIHSPFKKPDGTPIQPKAAGDVEGTIELLPEYIAGLKDLDGFSHIILLYHFHIAKGYKLEVRPFLDNETHGVFATRSPSRPNRIGMSIVNLLRIDNGTLHVRGIDILDGTPLLDIKPYVPEFDTFDAQRIGWLGSVIHKLPEAKDDGRFEK